MKRNRNRRVIVFFFHRWKYQCRLVRGRLRERHRLDEQCPQRCTGNKNRRVRVDHCHLVSPPFHLILFTGRRGPDVRSAAARLSSKRFSMEEKKREDAQREKTASSPFILSISQRVSNPSHNGYVLSFFSQQFQEILYSRILARFPRGRKMTVHSSLFSNRSSLV